MTSALLAGHLRRAADALERLLDGVALDPGAAVRVAAARPLAGRLDLADARSAPAPHAVSWTFS